MSKRISAKMKSENQELIKLISGKWKLIILWHLMNRSYGFNRLKREIGAISTSTLSRQLEQLHMDRFIERKVFPTTPVEVEYTLSLTGKTLIPILKAVETWATNFLD